MTKRNAAAVNNLNDATGADDVHDATIYNGNDTVYNSATVNFIAIGVFSSTTTVHNWNDAIYNSATTGVDAVNTATGLSSNSATVHEWNDAIYNNSPPRFSKPSTMRLVSTTTTNQTVQDNYTIKDLTINDATRVVPNNATINFIPFHDHVNNAGTIYHNITTPVVDFNNPTYISLLSPPSHFHPGFSRTIHDFTGPLNTIPFSNMTTCFLTALST